MTQLYTAVASTRDDGQTAVEYAGVMLLAAIVLAIALALGLENLVAGVPGKILSALP